MGLTRLSIQRPVFVIVLMAVFLILGMRARGSMQVELYPKVDIPYVTVQTTYPGAGPAEVESQVTKPIEDAVSAVNRVRHITSTSQYGSSTVTLEFEVGTSTDIATAEVRQKVDGARRLLPREVEPPTVDKFDIGAQPVLYVGLRGDRSPKELRFLADNTIKYRLAQIPGVARVSVTGGEAREIQVSVDKGRLQALGLTITDVVQALNAANMNVPSGQITEGAREFDARLIGEFRSVEDLKNVRLPLPGGLAANLADVATVSDATRERRELTRIWSREGGELKGGEAVGIVITKLTDANTVQVAHAAKAALAEMEKTLPGNLKFVIAQDQSPNIEGALEDVNVSLILGALLAIIVVFLFLHNLRGTFIAAIAIPTSLIATFIPMQMLGFTLNQMTMLGLSLVVGILVDDSIVVLESIFRHFGRGETPREAAFNGRNEIALAAITITLADVVVFLPMGFMGGIVGQFFRQFGLTVAVSTLFSLLVSFTVTPMLASRWFRAGEDVEHKTGFFARLERMYEGWDARYRRVLRWALNHRPHVVVGAMGALVLTFMWAGPRLGFQFSPISDIGQIGVNIEAPAGVSLATTDAIVRNVEKAVATIPEVSTVFTNVGSAEGGGRGGGESGPQWASLSIQLKDKVGVLDKVNPFAGKRIKEQGLRTRADYVIAKEIERLTADIPGARITAVNVSGFGGTAAPIDIQLQGFDLEQMGTVAAQIRDKIRDVPGIVNPDISLRPGKPEAQIIVDRTKAAELGLNVAEIGTAIRASIDGDTSAKYREVGDQFDIRVRFTEADRETVEDLRDVVVGTKDGTPFTLADVATIRMGEGPAKIERRDRLRVVSVSAYLSPGVSAGPIQTPLMAAVNQVPLGDIKINRGGDAESQAREFPHMISSFMLSIILVYLLMAILFNNLLHPFTIQWSTPMALTGALLALVLAGQTLSIISMVGFIMLIGLVQKNAILLIDYTNTLRARGLSREEAITEAGPARLRPILMTTFAMVFGMMPIALGIGRANEQRAPLATAVIGGLILSTILTLVVIPVVYTLFDDITAWLQRRFARGSTRAHSDLVDRALREV